MVDAGGWWMVDGWPSSFILMNGLFIDGCLMVDAVLVQSMLCDDHY